MLEFLDLPHELLRETVNQTRHDDTEKPRRQLSASVYTIQYPLQHHHKNRDVCFPTKFGDAYQSTYPLLHPLSIIRDIIQEAEVAYYLLTIIIDDFTALDDPQHITNNANNGAIDQIVPDYRTSEIHAHFSSYRYVDRRMTLASLPLPKNTILPPPSLPPSCQTFNRSSFETSQ